MVNIDNKFRIPTGLEKSGKFNILKIQEKVETFWCGSVNCEIPQKVKKNTVDINITDICACFWQPSVCNFLCYIYLYIH